jgi:hypothetical protein
MNYAITTFPHVKISTLNQEGVKLNYFTASEIYNNFSKYQQNSSDVKDEQKHFILAEYTDLKGARVVENISCYSSIVIDFDLYDNNYNELKEELTNALLGLNYLFYTTSSHSFATPRVRLIIFTNRNFLPSEKSNILVNLTQTFSSELIMAIDQTNTFGNNTLSRLPYNSPDFEMVYVEGKAYFIGDDTSISTSAIKETDFEKEFKTLTNNLPIPNLSEERIDFYLDEYKKLVGFNEQTGWLLNYEDWLNVGMILHHQYQGSEEGLAKWEKWCCESSNTTRYTWNKFKDSKEKPKTFKTIIKILKKNDKKESSIYEVNKETKIDTSKYELVPIGYFPDQKEPNKQGKIGLKDTYANFCILVKFYKLELGFDVITKNITLFGELDQNIGIVEIKDLLARNNLPINRASEYYYKYAMEHKYNSFLRMIESSKWDGIDRLETLYATIRVKPEYEELKRIYVLTWLKQLIYTSCFSTIKKGSKNISRYLLVLQSQQEGGKSTWVKNLMPYELENRYVAVGATLKTDDDQHTLGIIKKLIVELGEIEKSFKHSDINAFKAFFGRTVDTMKVKWVTYPVDFERTTSFIASTNDYYFLKDDTGTTRFMVLPLDNEYRTEDGLAIFCNGRHKIDMLQLYRQIYESEDWVNFELSVENKEIQKKINEEFTLKDTFEDLFYEEFTEEICATGELYNCTDILKRLGYSTTNVNKKLRNDLASFLRKKGFPCRKDGPKWRLVSRKKEGNNEDNLQEEDY